MIWKRLVVHSYGMKVLVPAKINILLYLLHKREDGYHELYSHFVPISLYDSLEIIPQNQSGITLEVDGMDFEEGLPVSYTHLTLPTS